MKGFSTKAVLTVMACILLACCALAQQLNIHHINVGQGDATLIVSPTGTTVLIDGGATGKGSNVVLPYLQNLGINYLDYVVASHYHEDHIGGLDEVINGIGASNVGTVYDRGTASPLPGSSAYSQYASAAAAAGRATISLGQTIDLGGGVTMKVVATDGSVLDYGAVPNARNNENNLSVCFLLKYNSFDYYTGGDAGGESSSYADLETPMAPAIGNIEAMKVNHHGSAYSTNQTFVNTLTPTVAFIPVGTNTYGHPAQSVLDRLANAGCKIYQLATGSGGTIPVGSGWVANNNVVLSTTGSGTFNVSYGSTSHSYTMDGTPITYNYSPSGVYLYKGSIYSGSYTNLQNNDGSYLVVKSNTSGTRITDWYSYAFISQPVNSITKLVVTYDGKYSATRTQYLYLWNVRLGAWQQINSSSVSTTDTTITYEITSNISDYIDTNGEIDLRVYASHSSSTFYCYGDQVRFAVTALQ
ncbi:MAG: MBL fold metallo-hydrolase [Armatimonadetes bacterium]|nr:MBL fold metallo-hydrolase [Armatimonadota bacterium]